MCLINAHYYPCNCERRVLCKACNCMQMLQLGQAPVAMLATNMCMHWAILLLQCACSSAFSSIQLNFHVIPALWGAEELAGQVQASPWGCPCAQSWSAVSWNRGHSLQAFNGP